MTQKPSVDHACFKGVSDFNADDAEKPKLSSQVLLEVTRKYDLVIPLIIWPLGLVTLYTIGGFFHIRLAMALVMLVLTLVKG